MRVVFLTHNYPRHAGDLPGAFLAPLARALQERGHDVRVVAPSDRGRGGEDSVDGIPVTRVRYAGAERERYAYSGRMQEAIGSPAGWVALAGLLRGLRRGARAAAAGAGEAVIHAHWWFPAGFAAPSELPTVVTLHGTDARLLDRPLAPLLARRALGAPRVVSTVSRHVADRVAAVVGRRVGPGHVCPMPLVVPTGPVSSGGGGLLVVGRLTGQKRVDLALRAHARLQARHPNLTLTIVGDGPARPGLERLAATLGTGPTVRWMGQLPPAGVASALASADVFLFPAEHEGLGLAAVEALTAGVPVVACRDGGGVLDILEEPGAGTVTAPDADAIATAAEGLLNPASRAAAARAGAQWADRLAPARVAERCEGWYREALGG